MTLAQLRTASKAECAGTGAGVQVSDFELDNMLNEVYMEWCVKSKCIFNTIQTINWPVGAYIDIRTISGIVNPIKPLWILNNNTNFYLSDEGSRPVFDRMRLDNENWVGDPLFWDLIDPYRIYLAPHYETPYGNFDMGYYSYPDFLVADSDIPVFSSDVHLELVKGVVFRYLESVEEFSKASTWESDFDAALVKFTTRVQRYVKIHSNTVL